MTTIESSVLNDVTFISVNVHARDVAFGCKLHIHTPVVALIPQLRETLLTHYGDSPELRDYLTAEPVEWALEYGPIREKVDADATLDEAGITPGTDLYLVHRTRTESFPVLRDDVAEGAAEVSKRTFAVLEARDTRRMGAMAIPAAVGAAAAVGMAGVLGGVADGPIRWLVVGALAALTLMCVSLAGVLVRSYDNYADVSAALSVGAYLAAAAAAVAGVPRAPGVWHLLTAGAVITTTAVALWSATGNRPAALHTGAITLGGAGVLVGLAHLVYPVSSQAVAAQLVAVAAGVMVWSTQTSRLVGGVQVNYIPTTGEPLVNSDAAAVHEVSKRSTSAAAIEAMLNQENRVITTLRALVGMAIGASVLLVVSAGAAGYFTVHYEWHLFALVIAAAVAAVAVGRGVVIRAASVPLVIAGPLAVTSYLVGRSIAPSPAGPEVLAAGLIPLLVIVLFSAIWAIRSRGLHSPFGKRRLELIAAVAVATVLPLLAFIMELWSRLRSR